MLQFLLPLFCNHRTEEEKAMSITSIVFLLLYVCRCSVSLSSRLWVDLWYMNVAFPAHNILLFVQCYFKNNNRNLAGKMAHGFNSI